MGLGPIGAVVMVVVVMAVMVVFLCLFATYEAVKKENKVLKQMFEGTLKGLSVEDLEKIKIFAVYPDETELWLEFRGLQRDWVKKYKSYE